MTATAKKKQRIGFYELEDDDEEYFDEGPAPMQLGVALGAGGEAVMAQMPEAQVALHIERGEHDFMHLEMSSSEAFSRDIVALFRELTGAGGADTIAPV